MTTQQSQVSKERLDAICKVLEEEDVMSHTELQLASQDEIWDAWLRWNGIIGFSDMLKTDFQAIFNVEVK